MKLSWYKYFNYGSIIFVGILLVLVLLDLIPRNLYTIILGLTILIFILRIVTRIYITRNYKDNDQEE